MATATSKEVAANRYAKELYGVLFEKGMVPFSRLLNEEQARADGMQKEWFL